MRFASAILFAIRNSRRFPSHVSWLLSLAIRYLQFFGFLPKNQRAERSRRSNSTAAHTHSQRHSDRFRLRQQHLGRPARRWKRAKADQLPGTNSEPAFLARRKMDRV